jgi:hypothetical protein
MGSVRNFVGRRAAAASTTAHARRAGAHVEACRRLAVAVKIEYAIKTTESKAAAIVAKLATAKSSFGAALATQVASNPALKAQMGTVVVQAIPTPKKSATTLATTTKIFPVIALKVNNSTNKTADDEGSGAQPLAAMSSVVVLILSVGYFH